MSTFEEKAALRAQGYSYREIAERLNISHQAVASSLSKSQDYAFRAITPVRCIYCGLRKWMNENKISVAELCRRMGYKGITNNHERISRKISGKTEIRKSEIDKIIRITGLTYEYLFLIG